MRTIWNHECKSNFKLLLIWSLSVGGMGFLCILLYQTMEGSMKDIADSFASMGAFSDAFGMNTLSIATLKGYFASQIGVIHGLGSSMFAASIGITILSKEEDLHTAEYLFSLPLSRAKILFAKTGALFSIVIAYHIVCGFLYLAGFLLLGQNLGISSFLLFMFSQILMSLEIASICFCISAFYKKNSPGIAIGLALTLYFVDFLARIVPPLKDFIFLTPFSYCNASEIFSKTADYCLPIILGSSLLIASLVTGFWFYSRKDLAS